MSDQASAGMNGQAPLSGLRVLDLADRSAALAGRVLADLGAEVILVEGPDGNPLRRWAPYLDAAPGDDGLESAAFHYFSANKRSVVLDLERDRETFLSLVASADALIDTHAPGRLASMGLDHAALRRFAPDLVQCSVTPFGLESARQDWRGSDLVASSMAGLVWLSGERRGTPVQGGADVAFVMAGLIAASGTAIALHQSRRTRIGVHIDVSLQEAAAMAVMQTGTPSQWLWHQRLPRRPGLSAALRCADGGYVAHLVRPDRFDAFLAWADREGIDHGMTSDDWRWARLDAPRAGNPVAETTLALAAKLTRDEFAVGALDADIICLPVLGFDDLESVEQYEVNDQFLEVDHPRLGPLGYVRSAVDGFDQPIGLRPAPDLGADQHLLDDLATGVDLTSTDVDLTEVADPATALEGIRVVDFTWVLAGPIGTRILASFGADVIRIESSQKPDSMRSQIGPDGEPDPDLGGLFNTVNAGKRSLAVDVSTAEGAALVLELIESADVVVNNFRPGAMERMGFGFERLRQIKPDLVMLNLPGAHPNGPWAERPSMGNILMAASGFNMLTGFPGERPRGIGIAYPDFTGPHLLATSVLAALRERDRSGTGQEITITQLTGMVAMLGAEWMRYKHTDELPARRANRDPNFAPHGVYPSLPSEYSDDEWIAIAVADDEQWRALAQLLDQHGDGPTVRDDERFRTHAARLEHHDALDEHLARWTATLDKFAAAAALQQLGVAAGPVQHLADVAETDDELREHYQFVRQPSRPDVDIPVDREPARWVGADHRIVRAPGVGEHNHEIVCGLLQRDDEAYIGLVVNQILG